MIIVLESSAVVGCAYCFVNIAINYKVTVNELCVSFTYKPHLKLLIIVKNYVAYNNGRGISVEVKKQELVARLKDIAEKWKFMPL